MVILFQQKGNFNRERECIKTPKPELKSIITKMETSLERAQWQI